MTGTALAHWSYSPGHKDLQKESLSALTHWWSAAAPVEVAQERCWSDLVIGSSSAFPSECSALLDARLHLLAVGKSHAYKFVGWSALDSFIADKASLLSSLVVRLSETEVSARPKGVVNVLLTKEQLATSGERLDGVIAGLRRVGCSQPILVYASLDTVIVEVGPKGRPLMLMLDADETAYSFRTYIDDFKDYTSASMSTAPSDSDLANLIAAYSVQQACQPKKPTFLSQIKNLSGDAFTTVSLSLS